MKEMKCPPLTSIIRMARRLWRKHDMMMMMYHVSEVMAMPVDGDFSLADKLNMGISSLKSFALSLFSGILSVDQGVFSSIRARLAGSLRIP
jgi:hypothetical protein